MNGVKVTEQHDWRVALADVQHGAVPLVVERHGFARDLAGDAGEDLGAAAKGGLI